MSNHNFTFICNTIIIHHLALKLLIIEKVSAVQHLRCRRKNGAALVAKVEAAKNGRLIAFFTALLNSHTRLPSYQFFFWFKHQAPVSTAFSSLHTRTAFFTALMGLEKPGCRLHTFIGLTHQASVSTALLGFTHHAAVFAVFLGLHTRLSSSQFFWVCTPGCRHYNFIGFTHRASFGLHSFIGFTHQAALFANFFGFTHQATIFAVFLGLHTRLPSSQLYWVYIPG